MRRTDGVPRIPAGLAQLVEHLICNQGVGGSNPSAGTRTYGISGIAFGAFLARTLRPMPPPAHTVERQPNPQRGLCVLAWETSKSEGRQNGREG